MIRLNDIVVKFDNFTALHGINVHVKEGEFFTFLGPSGCGKTTTLRTITGFIEPAEGTVVVKEQDITHVPIEDRNIGIVFQCGTSPARWISAMSSCRRPCPSCPAASSSVWPSPARW